jgi:hypothetical protein
MRYSFQSKDTAKTFKLWLGFQLRFYQLVVNSHLKCPEKGKYYHSLTIMPGGEFGRDAL